MNEKNLEFSDFASALRDFGHAAKQDGFDVEPFIKDIVAQLRPNFTVVPVEFIRGMRFNSDHVVSMTVRRLFTYQQFKQAPFTCVSAALKECGERDYYYSREVSYV